jgi:hypothetical protein
MPLPHDSDLDHDYEREDPYDLVARVRAARAEAQCQIEEFGDVSEYEIRKIYGQRTDIKYDSVEKKEEAPTPPTPEAHESETTERGVRDLPSGDPRQSAFDFKAEDVTPIDEEE